ncbi:MAG: type II secretion system F family protein [Burkholderiaceae bacterium]|nr:type II secretion system F family protein [Burkholderiaceae bacterium]
MDMGFALFAVVTFLAVVLALEGFYNLWASTRSPEARRISERLAALSGETITTASIERSREQARMPRLNALLCLLTTGQRMEHYVRASALAVSPVELILLTLALAAFGFFLPPLLGYPQIFGLVLGLVLALMPWLWVSSKRRQRIEKLERQFPEALDLMGRAMRAGHAFPSAVKMVGDEMPEPLGRDFRILFDEMNYGVPTNQALMNLAERVPLADVSYFAVAVMIQREAGGNLAELLDKIATIVRARLTLLGEVRTLSAEGKLSAIILTALPFCLVLVINLVNPKFMSVLWTDAAGPLIIGATLLLMVLGMLWMRSIIRIRV